MTAKYGLPENVVYCKRCTISNQRPNSCVEFKNSNQPKTTIHFDADGVCDACRVAEKKRNIDWNVREQELKALCNRFRGDGSAYDCLVPGSGGKDSVYTAHILKYKYGMHPLTVTWAPHLYTDIGRQNHEAWIDSGFDNILVRPNGQTHRLLTRLAVENLFHPFQPFILGQKNLAPQIAQKFGIPLVFYGENEAEYGNPMADAEKAQRAAAYYAETDHSELFLGGTSVDDLRRIFNVPMVDLKPYFPVKPWDVMEVHYLGYYLKWHPQSCYYYAAQNCGFQAAPERTPGTYSKYNSLDDKIDDFHYYTTYIKFGIGRATYDSSQEVRSGDITRDEGIALIKRFDGEFPERYAADVFEYLSVPGFRPMDREYFDFLCAKFRSPHLWDGTHLRHPIWEETRADTAPISLGGAYAHLNN